jgi:hypothetical protein
MPGPNVVNLSMMIGDRYFGLRGALVFLWIQSINQSYFDENGHGIVCG